jgi:hypothetical protein
MQYEIPLPADYDMGVIRERVRTRGRRTDDFPGLAFKAYLIREHQYAPFYLWHDTAAMTRFLVGGGGFGGIVADFGRPPVRHWTGVAAAPGPARGAVPRAASRHTEPVPYDTDPADVVAAAHEALREHARADGVHTAVLAFDPRDWELVRFTLWESAPAAAAGDGAHGLRYEVLHLSSPAA